MGVPFRSSPHDPSVAEQSTDGDVLADNVNDGFV
jgi:hypothetical protein